jgi:CPA1 family monovalent cation:H+ antiporter
MTVWDFAAFVSNSLIFLLIGARIAAVPFHSLGISSIGGAIILVLLGRLLSVYPLCALFSRSRFAVEVRHQHVLFWGGLRGALALALALSLDHGVPYRDQIVIATFAVID